MDRPCLCNQIRNTHRVRHKRICTEATYIQRIKCLILS